jgi:hypothetical protein
MSVTNCLHIHVSRWRSAGVEREPAVIWSCVKCHARFVPVEKAAVLVEQLGFEGFGSLAIAAMLRKNNEKEPV